MSLITVQDNKIKIAGKDVELGTVSYDSSVYFGLVQDVAAEGLFIARSLEYIKSRTYDIVYGELKHRMIFPVSHDVPAGVTTITYRTYDQVGAAKLISAYAQDLPRSDIAVKETTVPVRTIGTSFGYNSSELRAAAASYNSALGTGVPLDAKRAAAARKGVEITLNKVAWKGDAASGLYGIMTHPNVPVAVVPNGVGASPLWSLKTSAEILKDLNAAVNNIPENTTMVERPNRLLMTLKAFHQASTTIMTGGFNRSVLEQFLATSPYINSKDQIIVCNELVGIGPGGTDAMIAYEYSADKLTLEIPMEMMFHPEQRKGLEVIINCEASTGGLIVYYPLSVNIVYGM